MFYRDLSLPSIVEIGKNTAYDLTALLHKNHIHFEKLILFTQKELVVFFDEFIDIDTFYSVVFVKGGEYSEVDEIEYDESFKDALFVAFGGGSVIDFVKMYATKYHNYFISMPSTLSNDAIYSPIARLTEFGVKKSYGVKSPIGIIVDTGIIKHSPEILLIAGVGDLVSNLSAVKDCILAVEVLDEKIDSFSIYLSKICVDGVFSFTRSDIFSDEFIEKLTMGLILSGFSMTIALTSRPASGSEHLVSHAIDEFYPEKSTLHGLQVSWAQLMIEKNLRKDIAEYKRLKSFYSRIGLLQCISENVVFSEKDFFELIPLAVKTRNRYTIINEYLKNNSRHFGDKFPESVLK